ncbi:MAG: hypothetical protein M3Z24_01165 [Chloroflexota bacterium]|nr:hypothetical protein [Chloroflexota bacterium]
MSNIIIDQKTGMAFTKIPLSSAQASTFHSDHFTLDKVTAVASSIIQDAHTIIGDDYTDEEELEWDTLFAQPHVQAGLDRLAEKAERQFAAGETEEGGFAVE